MNNFHSDTIQYIPRWITSALQEASHDHPVVVLTGARQVGKSTLLLEAEPFRSWRYLSLDNYDTLQQVRERPEALWAGSDRIVLDEVQKAPELLASVKQSVDRHPGKYRFILSGSANLLLMKQVSESLAGRAVYFVLDPLTLGEIHRVQPTDILARALTRDWLPDENLSGELQDALPIMLRGLMPPLLNLSSSHAWVRWWEGYVTTYLERDLRQVSQIDALLDFRRLMEFTALRTGQLLNQSELARDAGLSQPTVHRYLNVLETTHLFERLLAYKPNSTTRLMKSPKAYWVDPGLAVFLSGYYEEEALKRARELGAFFESLMYHHLNVLTSLMIPAGRLYSWRTQAGQEVDFVLEHGRRLLGIEVKLTAQPGYRDAAGLRNFLSEYPTASGGLLLHGGREIRRLDENIQAVPWSLVTG